MYVQLSEEFFSAVTMIAYLQSQETGSGGALGIEASFLVAIHVCIQRVVT